MISLVIPCFNEEKRLSASLEKLSSFLKDSQNEFEVVISDDGSTDKTVEVAKSFESRVKNLKIIQLDHRGKGWAVNQGFKQSGGKIVVFTDADFSTPITEIEKLLKKIESGVDVAIGSRAIDRSLVKVHQNFFRETVGRAANILIQLFAVRGIKDTQCGFKAFKKDSSKEIFEKQKIWGFAFDVELLFLARKANLRISEVGVLWFNDPHSTVRPFRDTLQSLVDLMRIRLLHSQEKKSLLDRLFILINKKKTFTKFALVGVSGTLIDYAAYFILTRFFSFSPLEANPISVELAIIWNFTLNNIWTFSSRAKERSIFKKFLAFQIVSIGGLMLSQIQILIFAHYLDLFDLFAKALTIPVVAVFNYFVNNRWTFKNQRPNSSLTIFYLFLIIALFCVYLFLVKEITGQFSLFLNNR